MATDSDLLIINLYNTAIAEWPSEVRVVHDRLYYEDDRRRPLVPDIGNIDDELIVRHFGTELEIFYTRLHDQIAHSVRYALRAIKVVPSKLLRLEPIRIAFEIALSEIDFSDMQGTIHAYSPEDRLNRDQYFQVNGSAFLENNRAHAYTMVPWYQDYETFFIRRKRP